MKAFFADTSFFVAIFNPQDALHAKAKAVAASHQAGVVTTEFVLVEVGNFFCRGNAARYPRFFPTAPPFPAPSFKSLTVTH